MRKLLIALMALMLVGCQGSQASKENALTANFSSENTSAIKVFYPEALEVSEVNDPASFFDITLNGEEEAQKDITKGIKNALDALSLEEVDVKEAKNENIILIVRNTSTSETISLLNNGMIKYVSLDDRAAYKADAEAINTLVEAVYEGLAPIVETAE